MHSKSKVISRLKSFLRDDHLRSHHGDFPPHKYKNKDHPAGNVHLPWWVGTIFTGPVVFATIPFSWYFERPGLLLSTSVTAVLHFIAYNYVHSCYHVPKERWFERIKLFMWMDAFHREHHVRHGQGKPVNLAVALFLFDVIKGTAVFPRKDAMMA